VSDWYLADVMRGASNTNFNRLNANTNGAETSSGVRFIPTATGFTASGLSTATFIYIAIRRGPMKVPTLGTSVFAPVVQTPSGATTVTTGFPSDLSIFSERVKTAIGGNIVFDKLRGSTKTSSRWIYTQASDAETVQTANGIGFDSNTTIVDNISAPVFGVSSSSIYWNFRRAPSFFDEVCYTGTGTTQAITHNLGIAPELIIAKSRSSGTDYWSVQCPAVANAGKLNTDDSFGFSAHWSPITSTSITGDGDGSTNGSAKTYVAYLFATCAGVSKVGSYTGTGATQTIACGFAAGARFVLIKRTDTTGDWYIWDSARGMISGTDPSLTANTTTSEVNANSVFAITTGFQIVSTAAGINASGGTYIFLAIA
jgi:hypothetical protein